MLPSNSSVWQDKYPSIFRYEFVNVAAFAHLIKLAHNYIALREELSESMAAFDIVTSKFFSSMVLSSLSTKMRNIPYPSRVAGRTDIGYSLCEPRASNIIVTNSAKSIEQSVIHKDKFEVWELPINYSSIYYEDMRPNAEFFL